MYLIENLEDSLHNIVLVLQLILEILSVLCIAIGLGQTLKLIISVIRKRHVKSFPFIEVRLKFGLWLSMALELQLGADILETTIAPNLEFLTRLAVLAAIRTFLNYFLGKELAEELEFKEKNRL